MAVERSEKGGKILYELSSSGRTIDVSIVPGDTVEATLRSEDVNFVDLARQEASGFEPTPDEFIDAMQNRLDLVLDQVELVDVVQDEVALELSEGSIVIAGSRWGGPEELYPG